MTVLSDTHGEFFQHTLIVEPHAGTAGDGSEAYGAPFELSGWLDAKRRTVRTAMTQTNTGDTIIAEGTFYCDPGPVVPNESRVTLPNGMTSRVVAVLDRDAGSLPLPSHLEILIA